MVLSRKHQPTSVRASIVWTLNPCFGLAARRSAKVARPVALNDVRAVFHRPQPQKETDKGAVKSVRRFLTESGIEP
jgi:hypothetical protein